MLLDKLKVLDNLTAQEKSVLTFMITNPQKILTMNLKELAIASYTSSSTIVRLCQKAGFSGYSKFKYVFASEIPTIIELSTDLNVKPFTGSETEIEVLNKVEQVYHRSIGFTKNIFDQTKLKKISQMLKKAKRIEIYGDGINYELAQLFCLNFQEIGVEANAYNSLNLMNSKRFTDSEDPILAFILTHTGNNHHMFKIASKLAQENYQTIAVCDSLKRQIASICNETIIIMTTKNTIELSNMVYISSLQYLFDVLISIKMLDKYARVKKTSEAVDETKEGN